MTQAIRNVSFLTGAVVLQMEENNQLRNELQIKTQELKRYVSNLIHLLFFSFHFRSYVYSVVFFEIDAPGIYVFDEVAC